MKVFNVLKKLSFLLLVVVVCSFTRFIDIKHKDLITQKQANRELFIFKIHFKNNLSPYERNDARSCYALKKGVELIQPIVPFGSVETWLAKKIEVLDPTFILENDNDDTDDENGDNFSEYTACPGILVNPF